MVSTHTWTVAEAKAKFSEVLDKAQNEGPQRITRHGRTTAMVIAAKEWDRRAERQGTLAEFFALSPLRGAGFKAGRLNMKLKNPEL
jgi:prevent-host-death family protein